MKTRVPIDVEIPTQTINLTLPTGTPLMCNANEASTLFGISKTTLWELRKTYPDFPVKIIGRGVWFLVPDLYAWFRDFPGRQIPTQ